MTFPYHRFSTQPKCGLAVATSILLTGALVGQTEPGVIVPFEGNPPATEAKETDPNALVPVPPADPAKPAAPVDPANPAAPVQPVDPALEPVMPPDVPVDPELDFYRDTLVPGNPEMLPDGTPIDVPDVSPMNDPSLPVNASEAGDDGYWGAAGLDQPFQDSMLVPQNPDGFDSYAGGGATLRMAQRRAGKGLNLSVGGNLTYDSNIQRSSGSNGYDSKDDFIASIAPALIYSRVSGHWTTQATVQLSYNRYFKNSEMSGWGYSLGGNVGYSGGKWNASLALGTSRTTGGNRYAGGYAEQTDYTSSLAFNYEISPKTRLDGGLDYRFGDQQGDIGEETQSTGLNLAALWRYSPLLEFGPGFRYRWESSGQASDRITWGPQLRTRYRLGRKIALDSDLGVNFFDYSDASVGSVDPSLYAKLGINYQMNSIWGFNFSLGNDSTADELGGYRDTFHLRAGVTRPIRRASWAFGVGYESSESNSNQSSAIGSTDSLTIDSSVGMRVFGDRADAALSVLWRSQEEDSGDWQGSQISFSLGTSF